MRGFVREGKALFGAALAAFGVGCAEDSSSDVHGGDIKDTKKVEQKASEEILAQSDVMEEDDELYIPEKNIVVIKENRQPVVKKVDNEKLTLEAESKPAVFLNVLKEETDSIKPGDWMGDKYEEEVKRLEEKLPKDISKNKFNNSLEQLHRFFVPRGDDKENDVLGLLSAVRDGEETKFFLNKEYKEKVEMFAKKYGMQYGVPVEVIYGVMAVENAGKHDPRKNEADGAYGIMQVQPQVVKEMARIYSNENWDEVLVSDLEGNIRTGTAYLAVLNKRYGQRSFSMMAYNSGHAAFERDLVSADEGTLASRAKLRGEMRDLKKQIKELKKEKEVDEEAVRALEEKLKEKQEAFILQNEHLNQLRAGVVKSRGWKSFLADKNLRWAESKFGGGMYAYSNARYPAEAECLGRSMYEIMQSEGGEIRLTPLSDEMKDDLSKKKKNGH